MTKFRFGAMCAGAAMTFAFAGSAFAIDSKAACEYEGGEAFSINGDLVCVVPIRAEEFHGEEYDDAQLGVKTCEGELIGDGVFCKITLVKGKKKTTPPAEIMDAPVEGADKAKAESEKMMDKLADEASDAMN